MQETRVENSTAPKDGGEGKSDVTGKLSATCRKPGRTQQHRALFGRGEGQAIRKQLTLPAPVVTHLLNPGTEALLRCSAPSPQRRILYMHT